MGKRSSVVYGNPFNQANNLQLNQISNEANNTTIKTSGTNDFKVVFGVRL